MEALKPLVVLSLFGMILYGAYTVVQKGSAPDALAAASGTADVPPAAAPDVQPPAPVTARAAPAVAPDFPSASSLPDATTPTIPAEPGTTYLAAESATPPTADQVAARAMTDQGPSDRQPMPPATDRRVGPAPSTTASPVGLPLTPPATLPVPAGSDPVPAFAAGGASGAFVSAWADAHEKLAAGRYAEALAALSVWYDDPALGLEESQRLEDLLGQLAGTVIYSQQDLLLPPHVVAPGENLAAVAAPLGVSPQLLAKINGVEDPQRLVPGEHLKLVRGPFDAVVSVSRRRVSLQLNGAYAGSFPVVVGRGYLEKVGASLPVVDLQRGTAGAVPIPVGTASPRRAIVLGEGLVIEAAEDPVAVADVAPQTSLVMSVRDLDEILDILGPASRVLVRQ